MVVDSLLGTVEFVLGKLHEVIFHYKCRSHYIIFGRNTFVNINTFDINLGEIKSKIAEYFKKIVFLGNC